MPNSAQAALPGYSAAEAAIQKWRDLFRAAPAAPGARLWAALVEHERANLLKRAGLPVEFRALAWRDLEPDAQSRVCEQWRKLRERVVYLARFL